MLFRGLNLKVTTGVALMDASVTLALDDTLALHGHVPL
jgi:hypothetical protein